MSQMRAGPCYLHHLQNQRAVNFTSQRNVTGEAHYDFRHYLQAQLTNFRPSLHHQEHYHFHPHPTTARQHEMEDQQTRTPMWASQAPLQHPQPEHHTSTPSFFEDSFNYHPEEETLFIHPAHNQPSYASASRPFHTHTLPHHPGNMASASTAAPTAPNGSVSTFMPRLETDVDTTQYQPFRSDDWRVAFLDFTTDDEEGTSPSSTLATSIDPYTPATPDGDAGYADAAMHRFPSDLGASFGSIGSDMFSNVGFDFGFQPHSSEEAKADHGTMEPPARMGFQYTGHIGRRFGGLSLLSSHFDEPTHWSTEGESEDRSTQGAFRDVNGAPTNFTHTNITHSTHTHTTMASEKRGSASSSFSVASSGQSIESDEDADNDIGVSHSEADKYLLKMREKGHTYREIKRLGKFTEAESTLRGRVRVLTKEKSKRVRKPGWTANDISLLRRGVSHVRKLKEQGVCKRSRNNRLPWKLIATYVHEHGGSYDFAPATCARKWDEIGGR